MSVESVKARINPKYKALNNKLKFNNYQTQALHGANVSFQGREMTLVQKTVVGLMDLIAAGGYAAAFLIQDGLGFILPRVGKGLLRGGKKKKDENGNDILDKKGNPKRELNWAYARKEGIREVITGPSAFLIPFLALKYITKKFGAGNNVKLNYIDGFSHKFKSQVKANIEDVKAGHLERKGFYEDVFKDIIEKSINPNVADAEKMAPEEIAEQANLFAEKLNGIEKDLADVNLTKKQRKAKFAETLNSIVDDFMALKKQKMGSAVDEMAIYITSSDGSVKGGSIGETIKAMRDYFDDAVKNTHEELKKNSNASLDEIIKKFTHRRMGSRILTNIGLFLTVAMFYTQIPKLYNMGTNGKNPALMNDEEDSQPALQKGNNIQAQDNDKNKEVSFGGKFNSALEKTGDWVFNNKNLKSWSDIFELSGPVIQGNAMAILLYTFCIPPRLKHAQDKYDFGEVILRDMTAFTIFLFGAKALARLFSDGFTKITGLGLNKKDMKGRSTFKKVIDYLNPSDTRHSVLSSKQLESKYTNLEGYKGKINGFIEFLEKSGGDVRKAFSADKDAMSIIEKMLKEFNGKTYAEATSEEIKQVLKEADKQNTKLIKEFYEIFKKPNGLLNKAKTCNSTFGFLSTLLIVPGVIYTLTDLCKKLTDKRKAKEASQNLTKVEAKSAFLIPSDKPTMAGFLNAK